MFRRTMIALLACAGFVSFQAFAHEGHDHEEELTEQDIAKLGAKSLPAVVKSKKLAASWAKAKQQPVSVEQANGKIVWVVPYKNEADTGAAIDMLYLYFDDLGNFVDANHTGKVPPK